jgi:NADPH2:quinone reductase
MPETAQGRVAPLVAERLPLEEARRAHELLGCGGIAGKIVIVPNGAARVTG